MFGRPLPDGAAWRLSRRRSNLLVGCLLAVFWWPVKKLFRTMIFFLLVKDAIDWATDAAVRTAMVRRALERDVLPGDADAVWVPLDRCSDAHVASPVIRALLDPLPPPEPWRGGGSGLDGLLAWLVRWGRGHAALVAFDEALTGRVPDRIPASSPPALPEE